MKTKAQRTFTKEEFVSLFQAAATEGVYKFWMMIRGLDPRVIQAHGDQLTAEIVAGSLSKEAPISDEAIHWAADYARAHPNGLNLNDTHTS